jgi:4-amino-4-deoxy-L-arabinose transferase-like glycosyltransferase
MEHARQVLYDRRYLLCFVALGIVYLLNSFIDIMDIDAAQYAALSMEMSQTDNFLQVFLRGNDYLDKPPLLFWLSALSFKLFGYSNFAYKLPAILVLVLGLYSTYRYTRMWYDDRRAIYASLILGSSMAFLLMTNDVRTDGLLTGFVILSTWKLSRFVRELRWSDLILGAIGAGLAMMAKGPLGLVIIGMALGGDMLLKRDWKSIFNWKWLVFLAIVAVVLLPMCYGLYIQYDLHPEKEVYDLIGPSGVKFFFWTQSFGRITGDIYWSNDSGFFFFFHTILWDFQPWILLFIPALFLSIVAIFRDGINKDREYITLSGFVLAFLALSTSNYKLPHYIFPLFPFASVMVADFIVSLSGKQARRVAAGQFALMHLFFILTALSYFFFFSPSPLSPIITGILYIVFISTWKWLKDPAERIIIPTLIAVIALGIAMSTYFYPRLLEYQSYSKAAQAVSSEGKSEHLHYLNCDRSYQHSLDFYSKRVVPGIDIEELRDLRTGDLVLVPHDCEVHLPDGTFAVYKSFPHFRITTLNLDFLRRATRSEELRETTIYERN